jgi:hypothetical protein
MSNAPTGGGINLTVSPKRPKTNKNPWTHNFTIDEINELRKCAADPIYFITKYIKIVTLDDGIQPFNLWDFQKDIIKTIHNNRNSIILAARQIGKSQTSMAYYTWAILFNEAYTIALLANKQKIAKELLDRVKQSIELLPDFLYPQIVEWNSYSIALGNESRIFASSTTASGIRGMSINCIGGDSKITVRNKYTLIEEELTIYELYRRLNNFDNMLVIE